MITFIQYPSRKALEHGTTETTILSAANVLRIVIIIIIIYCWLISMMFGFWQKR